MMQFGKAMQFVAAAVLVLLSRLLRPFLLIRFGNLRNHTIGTLSLQAEGYVADRDLGLLPKSLDLFFHTDPRANRVLDRLLERQLHVTPLARYAQAINAKLPGSRDHIVEIGNAERDRARDHHRAFTETQQHFALNAAEISEARRRLRAACGIPDDARFICFFSRTSSYLKHLHAGGEIRRPKEIPTSNIRDSSILDYLPAAEELAKRGYWCFRMGAVVDETIPLRHERIIDYANSFRSELLDIYLISHCDLILSDTTGLADLAFMFRRPSATANYVSLHQIRTWDGLFIPKRLYHISNNRMLTAREVFALGLDRISSADWPRQSQEAGVFAVDNSPEEITDLALETLARHDGSWQDTTDDKVHQAKFRALLAENAPLAFGGAVHCVLASTFLRRHPYYVN